MANIPDGQVFVAGRVRENVVRLLEIASELEINPNVVKTTAGGYIVPAAVADVFEKETAAKAKAEEAPEKPVRKARATKTAKAE